MTPSFDTVFELFARWQRQKPTRKSASLVFWPDGSGHVELDDPKNEKKRSTCMRFNGVVMACERFAEMLAPTEPDVYTGYLLEPDGWGTTEPLWRVVAKTATTIDGLSQRTTHALVRSGLSFADACKLAREKQAEV